MRAAEVWKYVLADSGQTVLSMPLGAVVLSVGAQERDVVIWAWVDPEEPPTERSFWTALTGAPLPPVLGRFIGTVQRSWFVTHVWEIV